MKDSSEKKQTFRNAVKAFAEKLFGKEFTKLNSRQHSEAVLKFYLKEVYSHTTEPLSDEEIDEGFVDGKDAGVDFIRRDNGRVLVIQAKYRADGQSTEILEDLDYFRDVLTRINPEFGSPYKKNRRLEEAIGEIDFAADTFHLEYITLGRFHGTAEDILNQGVKELPTLPDLRIRSTLGFYDEGGLNDQLRVALSQSGGIPETVELFLEASSGSAPAAVEIDAPHKTLFGVVRGTVLANVYRTHKEPLFTLNIRGYLGRTKTNKEIIATLKREPESFLNYNNGIACVCKGFEWKPGQRKVIASKLQVVNGAQTLRCLTAVGNKLSEKALVAIKLTAIEDYYRADEVKFYGNVIRYSNTQNVIKDVDFRSNDPVQVDLQNKFKDLTFCGARVYYQIKRTDKKPSGSIYTIPITEFCKNLYAFFFDPTDFASRSTFLFDDAEGQGYARLFGDGKSVFDSFTRDQFMLYSGAWCLCALAAEWRTADRQQLLVDPSKQREAQALERTYFVFASMRLLLEKKYATSKWEVELRRFGKPDWCDEFEGKKYRAVRALYELAKGVVTSVYQSAAKEADFNHRNWTRSHSTFESIKQYVANIVPESFIPEL